MIPAEEGRDRHRPSIRPRFRARLMIPSGAVEVLQSPNDENTRRDGRVRETKPDRVRETEPNRQIDRQTDRTVT